MTKCFSVYDSKALCYGTPFFMPSVGAAVRVFSDLANDKGSMVSRHPEDFVLFEIGWFGDEKGNLVAKSPQVNLGLALDFVVRPGVSVNGKVDAQELKEISGGER